MVPKVYLERETVRATFVPYGAEEDFHIVLDSIPAANVVEVRHGEWVRTMRAPKSHDGYYFWNKPLETVFICSECGRVERVEEPYCNCGAKMDGKGEP